MPKTKSASKDNDDLTPWRNLPDTEDVVTGTRGPHKRYRNRSTTVNQSIRQQRVAEDRLVIKPKKRK